MTTYAAVQIRTVITHRIMASPISMLPADTSLTVLITFAIAITDAPAMA